MKKKMLKAVILIIIIILLILVGWYVMFMYLDIGPAFPFMREATVEAYDSPGEISETEPLLALTESEEVAKAIAEQYGITFVAYSDGMATYYTDEDPEQVIARGEENGYPTLYINYQRSLYDS